MYRHPLLVCTGTLSWCVQAHPPGVYRHTVLVCTGTLSWYVQAPSLVCTGAHSWFVQVHSSGVYRHTLAPRTEDTVPLVLFIDVSSSLVGCRVWRVRRPFPIHHSGAALCCAITEPVCAMHPPHVCTGTSSFISLATRHTVSFISHEAHRTV